MTTTTTEAPEPITMATDNWFQSLLDSEENDDGAYAMDDASEYFILTIFIYGF